MTAAVQTQRARAGTAVATTPKDTILATIQEYAHDIASLAPRGFTPAHYAASLSLHLQKNPDLLKCSPLSIAQGILRVAQTGLELGVSCDLLPFLGKNPACQFNPRYNGLVELGIASGARAINADIVREDDVVWEFEKGTEFKLRHQRGPGKGKIAWAYAIAEIKQGSYVFEVMSRDEIDALRRRYSKQWKDGELEAIAWYAKKSAIRKLSPLLPKNPRFAAALQFDADIKEIDGEVVDDVPEGEYEIQQEQQPAEAEGSPAAPEPEEPELTLEQARATLLIGAPGSWGGQAGKPLGSFSAGHLKSIRTWCATRLEEEDTPDAKKQLMVDAITLILNAPAEKPAINGAFPVEMPSEEAVAAGVAANEARAAANGL